MAMRPNNTNTPEGARPFGAIVADVMAKATRMYAMGLMVETFRTPAERKAFIISMYENESISAQAAELLIESFGLEAA